ncbi:hypothetical protein P7K49_027945 [Saguinus oedipus]|uniref:Uncharacterized protein n=1 Tax=Saguinus oedipus TaxID=9490 RepID=A0ABQ9UD42_SAGOE|nr:hypothetical protein P7K49_027945 [Saguinus oedipus]
MEQQKGERERKVALIVAELSGACSASRPLEDFPVRSRGGATPSPLRTPLRYNTRRPAPRACPSPPGFPQRGEAPRSFSAPRAGPGWGVRRRTATAASGWPRPARAGPPSLPSVGRPAAHAPHLGPRSPLLLLLLLPAPIPRGAGRAPVTCRAPGGLLLPPRHAARQPQPSPEFAGRGDEGTRGPGRGRNSAARPTLASSPRAPGSGRAADRGEPLAWTAAPGAAQEAAAAAVRAASRPPGCGRSARGLGAEPGVIPGAGRGRSGGRSAGRPAARAPCCRLPAAALLLGGRSSGAPLRALPCAFFREPRVAERNFLSPSPRCSGVAACVFSARVAAFSLCASEADPGCPFPPRT